MTTVRGRGVLLATLCGVVLLLVVLGGGQGAVAANETPVHEHPDDYDEASQIERVQAWLAGSLSERLEESAVSLSEGQYELARSFVGEEYNEVLSRYVSVDGDPDGETERAFTESGADQERVVDDVERYFELLAEYEDAVAAGEDERARELARELEALAARIDATSSDLQERYDLLTRLTDFDLTGAAEATNRTSIDVSSTQDRVRDEQFEPATLVVDPDGEAISFTEPFGGQAWLEDGDGERIDEVPVTYTVEGETVTTATGETTISFRPTTHPLDTSELRVSAIPEPTSVYLDAETTAPVAIEQETLTIEELTVEGDVGVDEAATVAGTVHVDGTPVDGLPIAVTVGDAGVGAITTVDGVLEGPITVPPPVAIGEQPVEVAYTPTDRAVSSASATTTVTVVETPTVIELEEPTVRGETVIVNASLVTAGGEPVEGAPLELRSGTVETEMLTGADGEASISLPSAGLAETVEVTYDDPETNLGPATATTTIVGLDPAGNGIGLPGTAGYWLAAAVIVALASLAVVLRRRGPADRPPAPPSPVETPTEQPTGHATTALLEGAGTRLADGHADGAVAVAYGAARQSLGAGFEDAPALTHWEFHERCRRANGELDLAGEDLDGLRELTESYEQARYAPTPITEDRAAAALALATDLCGRAE